MLCSRTLHSMTPRSRSGTMLEALARRLMTLTIALVDLNWRQGSREGSGGGGHGGTLIIDTAELGLGSN
ncbi:pollen-specific leucine-rich repeat extensin-like protein 4 [Iris pallida]|uniref:Pollen-specific leucine-rich repeat extensin-like protein 4 n=1 Tax=Iris pallida TaxID=29817 RepID=A0AAX6EGQ4_IRIPA|nr:pollen-specific leucine-rich repeat extensin-like protein 4 [Iris pallida]